MNALHRLFTGLILVGLQSGMFVNAQGIDPSLLQNLHWRMIGPHRGGRTVGVAGITDQPSVFYIGVNNGGVWRTSDYGRTWVPVFDDQSTGSVGALAVAPSNPNTIYVGTGEGLQRPDLSVGDGMFKSTDGGKSWRHVGLPDAQQIGAVIVDPRDERRVFVAVLGHPYGANEQRGIFRSTDGGESWQKVLYKDENTGAIALSFDPKDPDIVYASLWSARQGPWENGSWQGKTSGLFKSVDGGSTWKQLTQGLPTADQGLGRIGFCIAPSDPSRIYAMVDAGELGGVYRSDDAGEHWKRTSSEGRVWGRGDDFAEVKVHPGNPDVIFVANTSTYKSTDGGATFTAFKGAPGGDDYHTVWINPLHPEIIVLASDQGAVVSVNGGASWGSWYNQPTAQFYHVITDNEFPYNVYGGQQESGSVGIASRGNDGEITFRDWHPVAADEWAYIAPDPLHPNIIFGGKVTKYDKQTEMVQNVAPEPVRSGKYRFLRTSPLMFSPANPHDLYLASNVLFKTTNGGSDWSVISPDLSREKPDVPANVGIFNTPALAQQPRRGVIYALGLSPLDENIIWAGTDDGYVHMSSDGGAHWTNVTPTALTSWSKIAGIDAGHFDKKTAYIAVTRIKLDDQHPHIYRTHDGGATWKEIVEGLPESGPVNTVREDPERTGLLFAGSERAVYVSEDDGENWQSLRLNMPATSIRDLVVHKSDVVVGTHGRSFWILDDITPLRQLPPKNKLSSAFLFQPDTAYRVRWNSNTDTPLPPDEPAGQNPPDGGIFDYFLPGDAKDVSLEIRDQSNNLVRRFSAADSVEAVNERDLAIPMYWLRTPARLSGSAGIHRFVWDLHYAPPRGIRRSYPIAAVYRNTASAPLGPWVKPGTFTVTLSADGISSTQHLVVRVDPRVKATDEILSTQSELSLKCYGGVTQLQECIDNLRNIRSQVKSLTGSMADGPLKDTLSLVDRKLAAVEGTGAPGDMDVVYFATEDELSVKETFGGLQTKFLYLEILLQSAEALPTTSQRSAIGDNGTSLTKMTDWWKKFKTGRLTNLNDELSRAGMKPIVLQ